MKSDQLSIVIQGPIYQEYSINKNVKILNLVLIKPIVNLCDNFIRTFEIKTKRFPF